eukprot:4274489-Pyramimonas_sp.AAC.1
MNIAVVVVSVTIACAGRVHRAIGRSREHVQTRGSFVNLALSAFSWCARRDKENHHRCPWSVVSQVRAPPDFTTSRGDMLIKQCRVVSVLRSTKRSGKALCPQSPELRKSMRQQ